MTQPSVQAQLDEIANRIYQVWKCSFLVHCPYQFGKGHIGVSLENWEFCGTFGTETKVQEHGFTFLHSELQQPFKETQ